MTVFKIHAEEKFPEDFYVEAPDATTASALFHHLLCEEGALEIDSSGSGAIEEAPPKQVAMDIPKDKTKGFICWNDYITPGASDSEEVLDQKKKRCLALGLDPAMKRYFEVVIAEVLRRSVYVCADSPEQASDIIQGLYNREEIVLDADDFEEGEISEVTGIDEEFIRGSKIYTVSD